MHKARLGFQWLGGGIVNGRNGANMAGARLNPALAQPFGNGRIVCEPFRQQGICNEDEGIDAANRRFH